MSRLRVQFYCNGPCEDTKIISDNSTCETNTNFIECYSDSGSHTFYIIQKGKISVKKIEVYEETYEQIK
jgi:hypothetical protein